LISGPQYLVAI